MYIYPDNLKARATLWLWQLKDIGIIGVCALCSILALTQAGIFPPIVFTAVYAFLTIRFEDTSILDFIRYACGFFFVRQQFFEWRFKVEKNLRRAFFSTGNLCTSVTNSPDHTRSSA